MLIQSFGVVLIGVVIGWLIADREYRFPR